MIARLLPIALLLSVPQDDPAAKLAATWIDAIRKINEGSGGVKESEFAKRIPKEARRAFDQLLALPPSTAVFDAQAKAAEAALELDLQADFAGVLRKLEKGSPEHAKDLGTSLSRDRYQLRGLGGLDRAYLEKFAKVMDAVLGAYDELFGFEEWSKVPGKKLRIRIHLEAEIQKTAFFDSEPPYHCEIDFPVVDPKAFTSPTPKGDFLLYGLCHEMGRVIAMWGNRGTAEDHHAWAHYVGVTIVEHLSKGTKKRPELEGISDVSERSLEILRTKEIKDKAPSVADREGVLALFVALHDRVGTKAMGTAINTIRRGGRGFTYNRVRYATFGFFKEALLQTVKDPKARAAIAELLP